MSHHSDENAVYTSTDSFWEVGNYKRTTKRIEDGNRLCEDLMKLVSERAEIEKMYAKSLKDWAKKWNNTIEKGPEYGTTEAAWKGVLMEAEQRCDLHMRVRENLINEVHSNVKQWQRDSYHKSMMGQLKEKKDIEDMFKKAQKPWAKLLEKVNKQKADYHNACKNERSAQNQERNAGGDSSLSPDQYPDYKTNSIIIMVKKLRDRVSKASEEVSRGREKYDAALRDISDYNPKYIEEMTHVFEKAQEAESKRLMFFKDMLFATHKCLNISNDPSLPRIYEEFNHTVANADYEKDLKWWSNNHGVNMPMNWPSYEEYSEEFRDISGKGKRGGGQIPEGAITLLNQRTVGDDLPDYTPELHRISKKGPKGAVSGGGDITLTSVKGPPNHTSPATSKASDNNRHSAISMMVSNMTHRSLRKHQILSTTMRIPIVKTMVLVVTMTNGTTVIEWLTPVNQEYQCGHFMIMKVLNLMNFHSKLVKFLKNWKMKMNKGGVRVAKMDVSVFILPIMWNVFRLYIYTYIKVLNLCIIMDFTSNWNVTGSLTGVIDPSVTYKGMCHEVSSVQLNEKGFWKLCIVTGFTVTMVNCL
ncbi:protein kinase C and casein kinase substrate in neurons protein 1-like isoform X4 [Macrobrachium nipponense]|uniref:protein kinase C and casein kinase substrate in neurons protein 1-like isoform X4 n=1 Tax=Macrobrachium nipponense TaxID=159736 RepID=UPI0030C87A4F